MTNNEIIAAEFWDRIKSTDEAEDGDLARFAGATGIVIVTVNEYKDGPSTRSYVTWNPSEYIEDWHGKHGLLQKIEERGLLQRFTDRLIAAAGIVVEIEHDGSMWLPIESVPSLVKVSGDPAQLTAALVAMIEERA